MTMRMRNNVDAKYFIKIWKNSNYQMAILMDQLNSLIGSSSKFKVNFCVYVKGLKGFILPENLTITASQAEQ